MQTTKQSFAYVFNRETGEPVWPIEERPVPRGHIPGEYYSATQPFPTKPPAYEMQGLTDDDVIDFTPELRQRALEILTEFEYGPLFTHRHFTETTTLASVHPSSVPVAMVARISQAVPPSTPRPESCMSRPSSLVARRSWYPVARLTTPTRSEPPSWRGSVATAGGHDVLQDFQSGNRRMDGSP